MTYVVVGGDPRAHDILRAIGHGSVGDPARRIALCRKDHGIASTQGIEVFDPRDITDVDLFLFRNRVDIGVISSETDIVRWSKIFGDNQISCAAPTTGALAITEASKFESWRIAKKVGTPVPQAYRFDDPATAKNLVRVMFTELAYPLVIIKADGFAAGKGTTCARSVEEAHAAIDDVLVKKLFGEQSCVVVQEPVVNSDGDMNRPLQEFSVHAAVFGLNYVMWPTVRDSKYLRGQMTGGTGAYILPNRVCDDAFKTRMEGRVKKFLHEMTRRGHVMRGFYFPGFAGDPPNEQELEKNVRMGCPESGPLMMYMRGWQFREQLAFASGHESGKSHPLSAVMSGTYLTCMLMTHEYPRKGHAGGVQIHNLDEIARRFGLDGRVTISHGATSFNSSTGEVRTVPDAGRVLGINVNEGTMTAARSLMREVIGIIDCPDLQWDETVGLEEEEWEKGQTG